MTKMVLKIHCFSKKFSLFILVAEIENKNSFKTQSFCMGMPFLYTLTLEEQFQPNKLLHLFNFPIFQFLHEQTNKQVLTGATDAPTCTFLAFTTLK